MPYKEKPIEKIYWSIGEVSRELNVKASQIRFWLKTFDVRVKTNGHHNRMFTEADKVKMREIYFLLKVECYTLKGAKLKLA